MASDLWNLGGIGDGGAGGGQSSKTLGAWKTGRRPLRPPGLNS